MTELVDLSLFATSPEDDWRFTTHGIPEPGVADRSGIVDSSVRRVDNTTHQVSSMKPLPPLPRTAICQRICLYPADEPRSRCILQRLRRIRSEEPQGLRATTLQQRRKARGRANLRLTVPPPLVQPQPEALRSDPAPASEMIWLEEEAMWHRFHPADVRMRSDLDVSASQEQTEQSYPSSFPRNIDPATQHHVPWWHRPQQSPSAYSYYEPQLPAYTANRSIYYSNDLVEPLPAPPPQYQAADISRQYTLHQYDHVNYQIPDIQSPPLTPVTVVSSITDSHSNFGNADNNDNHSPPLTPIQSQFLTLLPSFGSITPSERLSPTFQEAVSGFPPPDLATITSTSSSAIWADALSEQSSYDMAAAAESRSHYDARPLTAHWSSFSMINGGHEASDESPQRSEYSGRIAVMERVAMATIGGHRHDGETDLD